MIWLSSHIQASDRAEGGLLSGACCRASPSLLTACGARAEGDVFATSSSSAFCAPSEPEISFQILPLLPAY